ALFLIEQRLPLPRVIGIEIIGCSLPYGISTPDTVTPPAVEGAAQAAPVLDELPFPSCCIVLDPLLATDLSLALLEGFGPAREDQVIVGQGRRLPRLRMHAIDDNVDMRMRLVIMRHHQRLVLVEPQRLQA